MSEVIPGVEHKGMNATLVAITGYDVYTVTSGRRAELKNVIVTNFSGDARVDLYDSASGGTGLSGVELSGRLKLRVIVGAIKTEAMGDDFIKGVTFHSSVHAITTVSGTWIHVGMRET